MRAEVAEVSEYLGDAGGTGYFKECGREMLSWVRAGGARKIE